MMEHLALLYSRLFLLQGRKSGQQRIHGLAVSWQFAQIGLAPIVSFPLMRQDESQHRADPQIYASFLLVRTIELHTSTPVPCPHGVPSSEKCSRSKLSCVRQDQAMDTNLDIAWRIDSVRLRSGGPMPCTSTRSLWGHHGD